MEDSTRTQTRLFILVILAFLPAVGLYLYARATLETHEVEQQEQELLQFAHVASVEYERYLDESEQLLGALAEFPDIGEGNEPACSRRLASVRAHTPQYTTLSLIGMDGYLACGSLTPSEGLYLGDRAYYTQAVAVQRFSVGDYAVGRITGKPTVGVAYPIRTDDGTDVRAVLAASLDLSTLGARAREHWLPERGTFTILHHNRTVLVRVPEGNHPLGYDTVGAVAPESFPELSETVEVGAVVTGIDLDGVERRFAVVPLRSRSNRPEGYLLVGVPEAIVLDQAHAVARRELQFLGVAGVAVLILAWLFGHYALVGRDPAIDSES